MSNLKRVVNNNGAFPYEINGELKYSHEANLLIAHRPILWGIKIGNTNMVAKNEDQCVYQLIRSSFRQYNIEVDAVNSAEFFYSLVLN